MRNFEGILCLYRGEEGWVKRKPLADGVDEGQGLSGVEDELVILQIDGNGLTFLDLSGEDVHRDGIQ